jgi:hypothetical protein
LAKSIVIPIAVPVGVSVENGVLVPEPVQYTRMLAGMQFWTPWPHVTLGATPPTVWTDNSLLTAVALKSGGADPKGATMPSIHKGSPTVVSGIVIAPVFTA